MTTPDEQPVKSSTDHVDAAARRAIDDPSAALALLPGVAASIRQDAAGGLFDAWELSSVVDENTREPVVPEALFHHLHAAAGLDATWPAGNAGLVHVYGYLFSLAETPYGLKRERWLDAGLAAAYGERTLFHAEALIGGAVSVTPLARITDAARALLAEHTVREERIGPVRARIAIGRRSASGPFALAYAIDRGAGERLVTTFPISTPAETLAAIDAGPPRLRWNAVE
ncbi:amino acid deaminase [Microbacterium sp. BG28]|uniref:amino acid deaminase n=1 Tax=Microbacterium sp. BG28 TaxID=3097356 RepID=UPI002A5A58A1|nr:amino acid deaminase [Microbacterium sp. BG28]MDY0827728.1 amino acid deaminase [Microbacterium sp. BG28]